MTLKKSCSICEKNIRGNAKSVLCNYCNERVHIKCNSISNNRYTELNDPENTETFLCSRCFNEELPFGLENDKTFNKAISLGLENSNLLYQKQN